MTPKIRSIAAFCLFTALVPSVLGASLKDQVAQRVKLRSEMAEQAQQISTLALYSARLKGLLGNLPAGGAVKSPDEKMRVVLLKLDLDNTGISGALNAWKAAAKIDVAVDWQALHAAGVEKNTPVTCHLRNCLIGRALHSILAAADGATSPLWFNLENGVVSITTQAELAKHPLGKTYDVKFLLARTSNPGNMKESQAELSGIMMQVVAPESWKDKGGTLGSISFAGAAMTVTQSKSTLMKIDQFLRTLEEGDIEVSNQHNRATVAEQGRQIAAWRAEITGLTAGLRAAGRKVPPEPLPLDKALAKALPEIKFDGVGLADCVEYLGDVSGQEIFVNWKAIEEAGIDRNTPISLGLVKLPFSEAITQVLTQAAAGKTKLGFAVDDNVLTLSTQADLDRDILILNYEIRDLLPAGQDPHAATEKLIESLQKSVEPDTWTDNGGKPGSIRMVGGEMFITQSNRVHRLIESFFNSLRHPGKVGLPKG